MARTASEVFTMLSIVRTLLFGALMVAASQAHSAIKVFACEPEWGSLVAELAGDQASVFVATTAQQDPHHIEARPALIARLRQADLLVCTGADLEAGWLPLLQRQAANRKVQSGAPGFFEAAAYVERLEVPATLDRALGDIHAAGNPHVQTDPRRIAAIAARLGERLAEIDPEHAGHYRARLAAFTARWKEAMTRWSKAAAPLKGARAVAHHKDWVYLYDWLGMKDAGVLESKPGIPPTAGQLAELKARLAREPARLILITPHQDPRAARWLAEQTGMPVVELPYTVGGNPRANDLVSLFDDTVERLLAGLK
jgi:zinc/manganese transport system substrate-binding protein